MKTFKNPLTRFYLGISIRYKISLIMIAVMSVSIILISGILFGRQKALLLEQMKLRGTVLSKNLANAGFEAIINKDRMISSDSISGIMKDKGILYCVIYDKQGAVIDSAGGPVPEAGSRAEGTVFTMRTVDGKRMLDIATPVEIEYKGSKVNKGSAHVGLDWSDVLEAIAAVKKQVFFLSLFFLLVGVVLSLLFARSITGPLMQIVSVMKKVGQGDLDHRVEVSVIDEVGKLADAFNEMIRQLKEKLMMSKYVSKSTMEMISQKEDGKLELGGERKTVALFFSDIRGFTSYSESRTPEEVIIMLNTYLSVQAEIIDRNGGSIDKFVGDEVVAVFEGPEKTQKAVISAVEIQEKIAEVNKKIKGVIAIGIGINTGDVVMGNMGSQDRMDHTVIGDNVNLAARLCSAAEPGQVLLSEPAWTEVKDRFKFGKPKMITVKGKKEPLRVYDVRY